MEFSPTNRIVQLCMQGMHLEETGNSAEAGQLFLQAWEEAANDFEKFMAAWFVARSRAQLADQLDWYQVVLQLALKLNNDPVKAALPALYDQLAKGYAALDDADQAQAYRELAQAAVNAPSDRGPFYHGTRADLKVGDLLIAGRKSNYQSELVMNHVYFTALISGAGLAAALAKGESQERVYLVEPSGDFEDDPNVTNKKFPGNPTRSYRTQGPLKIIGEVVEWQQQTPEQIQQWRERLANNQGDIIN